MTDKNLDKEWSVLMKQSQRGDAHAYETLLAEISEFLSAYLGKRIFNQDHVEDVSQDILLAIHRARHTYEEDRPFFPWVHAIIKYKMIDYFKTQKRKVYSLDESPYQLEDSGSFKHQLDTRFEIESLMSGLPEKYQQLLKTVKLDGYSVKEAAQLLGMSVANVKTSVHRALKLLKNEAL